MLASNSQKPGIRSVMRANSRIAHAKFCKAARKAPTRARTLLRTRPGTSLCTAQPSRTQLVSLTPRAEKIVENQGSVNTKVLASAGVVCILTNCLTVQGLLLTAYLAAGVAVPTLAAKHAIKHRNAWPIVALVVPILLVAQTNAGRALYMSAVNPMSVQIKARVTLPALIHAFIGAKHPMLATGMQAAKVVSQVVLLALLLQYLVAPKVAESMRQKAIMLCRALTTTESASIMSRGSSDGNALETWPNKSVKKQATDSSFVEFISRGSPTKFETGSTSQQDGKNPCLPEGQRPSINEVLEKAGTQYSYASTRSAERAEASKSSQGHFNQEGYWQQGSADGSGGDQIGNSLTELEIQLESQLNNLQEGVDELDEMVDSISSPQELFAVLNEQLSMVQGLSEEIRDKGLALQHSEEAREDLVRELEATVGEKQQLGEQLSQLALKLEAAQSMWERHAEHDGGDVSSMHEVTEEVLDKVVAALTERRRSIHTLADFEVKAVDPDALAARFRVFPEETAAAIMEGQVIAGADKEHYAPEGWPPHAA